MSISSRPAAMGFSFGNTKAWWLLILLVIGTVVVADERRAPPPKFDDSETRGIFFENLQEAFPIGPPKLAKIRASRSAPADVRGSGGTDVTTAAGPADDRWSGLVSPASIEDEIKRVRLHFDSTITNPGDFSGGGYQVARLDLTILATLFAVIHEHGGDVRWKEQAAAARDLLARTAFNCKAGSTQVYNEAKLRKADLQDLVSGGGLSTRAASQENDWSSIAGRSPLMEYLDQLIDALEEAARNEASIKTESDLIKRNSELMSMIGEVLVQEGMDDADDADYAKFSRSMTETSQGVSAALKRMDTDAVRQGAAAIRQRCDACHEHYR